MSHLQRAVTIVGTQRKLAEAIGVTPSRISQCINGEPLDIKYFERIQEATGGEVTPAQLLEDELAKLRQAS